MLSEMSPAREKNGAYGRPFVGDAGCGEVLDRHLHRAGGISSLRPAPGDASVTTAWRGVFRREVRVESGQQRPPLRRPSPRHRSRGVPGSWSRAAGYGRSARATSGPRPAWSRSLVLALAPPGTSVPSSPVSILLAPGELPRASAWGSLFSVPGVLGVSQCVN